jgi:hypothetical protein
VIEMEIRSKRYLAPCVLPSSAARAGRVIGRLMWPWQRVVPLAAAMFLAVGVLTVSGPLPAALPLPMALASERTSFLFRPDHR